MRLVYGVLVCLGVGGLSTAWAEEQPAAATPAATPASASAPAQAPAAPTAAEAPTAPTASAAPSPAAPATAAARAPDTSQIEKHFRSEGYSVQMHDGQKVYCRREEAMGSRLGGKTRCSTMEQLQATEQQAKATTESIQNSSRTGCLKPCS